MKEKERIHYFLALSAYMSWLDSGFISKEELEKIEGLVADKYGIKKHSIYRYKA